jgi:hypothetical protein
MMDPRQWFYDNIVALDIAPVYGGGSLTGSPADKPFIVISMENAIPGPFRSVQGLDVVIRVHDEPGGYALIGEIMQQIKDAVDAGVEAESIQGVVWQGDSGDLADDGYGTIFRSISYRINGRK